MQVTITLTQVLCGTDLAIEQAGIPAVIPVEMCYLGWQGVPDAARHPGGPDPRRVTRTRGLPGGPRTDTPCEGA